MNRTFSSLRIRNYRYYFAGQSLSSDRYVDAERHPVVAGVHPGPTRASEVGLVVALQTLPILLFGPARGDDRRPIRQVPHPLLHPGAGRGAGVGPGRPRATGHLQLWELYAIALSLGFINTVDNPTRQTFVAEMVGRDQLATR